MKMKLVFLLIGMVFGGLIATGAWMLQRPQHEAQVAELKTERQQLRAELAPLQKRVTQLEAENGQLTADNLTLKKPALPATTTAATAKPATSAPASPFAALFGGGNGTNQNAGFSKLIKAGMQQQIEGKISALKLRLKLTDAQEAAIREKLQAHYDRAGEMASRMFQGKASRQELMQAGSEQNVEAEIRQQLTPEQLAEYDKFQQEERQTMAARVANMELLQMQTALQLSPEQQEQVYNILYDQTLTSVTGRTGLTTDPVGVWKEQMDAKTEALRKVLTPEQLAAYTKQQEAQRQMISSFMQSFGNATNSATDGVAIQVEIAP